MQVLILIFLILLFMTALYIAIKLRKTGFDDKIHSTINKNFLSFQDTIHKTMENTRREVEMSKNLISDHAVKTIDTIREMSGTIEKMVHQYKEVHDLGNSLKYLLQTPKLRGSYGEEVLEEMLDKILPKGIWERQYPIDENERVDAVIKYKDIIIPIDAKFPREIYEKYLNAEDVEEKKRNWKAYEEGLKIQILSIKNKYVKPHKGTSQFAFMFIPSESIYYETIAEKNYLNQPCQIYEYARNNNVVPVSPNTFYAFLQVIIMGIRNLDIITSAKKLQEALVKMERNFNHFYSKYEEMGTALEKAYKAYQIGDNHIVRFKDNLNSTIKLELPEHSQIEQK